MHRKMTNIYLINVWTAVSKQPGQIMFNKSFSWDVMIYLYFAHELEELV